MTTKEDIQQKNFDRLMNLNHWLNHQANLYCSKQKKKYNSCPKTKLALDLFNEGKKPVEIWYAVAYQEPCACHSKDFGLDEVMSLWLDDTAKKYNYGQITLKELLSTSIK